MSVLGSICGLEFGWFALWFRYPVSGVGAGCVNAEAMNRCMR